MNQPQSPPTSGTVTRSVLPSGIRLLTERIPHVRTVAVGIWVGVGSRYEPVEQHGISHFLEHLFFKGTATRSALEIAQAVDDIGGQMNAFTDREQTVFYVKVLSSHLDRALEIYADMLLHSTLAAESIERERQVIAEEIKSYEDSPDELVQDLFAQTVWNGHPLGRPVIGTLPTVNRLTRDDFVEHIRRFYRPNNVVLAAAGDLDHDQVAALIGRYFGTWEGAADPVRQPAPQPEADIATRTKETEQVHLCLGTQGLAQADERRYALSVLDHLLGGGMSSRLFQEIRERRGLVYSISSYAASYRDGGLFVVYAGMSPDAGPEVIRLTLVEIEKIARHRVDDAELHRAKESLKGGLMLGLESTGSRMSMLARSEVYHGRQISLDELIAKVDAVTDVLIEFSPGAAAAEHARVAIPAGVRPVIGATGIGQQDLDGLAALCGAKRVGAVVAPNFAVGAVLMIEFARQAARHFPNVEIIELHHDRKRDAPSGTALRTAAVVAAARGSAPAPAVKEEETITGARGGRAEGIRVHSVRLPGLAPHREVILGRTGHTLVIRHDSVSEESFMPGLMLAARKVRSLTGLVYGLEKLLVL